MARKPSFSRRDFLRTAGAATVGSLLAPLSLQADTAGKPAELPTRPFGNSGVTVPILSLSTFSVVHTSAATGAST